MGSGSKRMSEDHIWSDMDNINDVDGEPFRQDIGNDNAQTDYVSMEHFSRATAIFILGTFNATDTVDVAKIQQATNSSGGSVKDLTDASSGGNYDTANSVGSDGDFIIIEIRAEDGDYTIGTEFPFIRAFCSEASDTGTDLIGCVLNRHEYAYDRKELQGAPSAASQVYVTTRT